jgi:hypothetical protein
MKKLVSGIMLTMLLISMLTLAFNIQPAETEPASTASQEAPPTEWTQTYGGTNRDYAYSVVQTSDGGYALVGYTDSFGAGNFDFWLVKVAPPPGIADFSVTAQPSSLTTPQGSYSLSAITITSRNGFSQPVNIEVSAPYGVGITLLPSQVTPQPDGSVVATLIVSASVFSTLGSHVLTVTGTSGALTHTTYLSLEITKAPSTEWTFAVITDIHMGYNYTDYGNPGWDDSGGGDYPLTDRLTIIVNWVNAHKESDNIDFVVVLGDISDTGEKSEFIKARDILNGLNVPYIPLIGNHDIWPYTQQVGTTDTWRQEYYWRDKRTTKAPYATVNPDYSKTRPPMGDLFFDEVFWQQNSINLQRIENLFGSSFTRQSDPVEYEYIQNYEFTYKGIKFIALDLIDRNPAEDTQSSNGVLHSDTEQWLTTNLAINEPTVLFSHHAIETSLGGSISLPGSKGTDGVERIYDIIQESGCNLLANFAGHNHRNAREPVLHPGIDCSAVTTEAVCRESISWCPDIHGQGLVTREKKNIRLVNMTLDGHMKDYRTQVKIDDSDMVVPHWWDPGIHVRAIWGNCPIDLEVTDPDGFTITKQVGAVAGMSYFEGDWDCDGTLDDLVLLDFLKVGNYTIHVLPESGALPNETYTLQVFGSEEVTFLAENASISEIPADPFIANSTSFTLNVHPTTLIDIGEPKIVNGITYVSPSTPLDFMASDKPFGSGLTSTAYRIYNATFDTGWTTYTKPIYLLGLCEGTYQIDYNSTDCAGNIEPTNTATITLKKPNIGVAEITLSKTIVGQGLDIRVNITVQNLGMFSENFTNALYANTTAVGTQKTRLASNASTTITFTWNTSGFAKGNYIITAYAEPIVGETTTGDNTQSGGIIIVTIPGDVNGDRKVDAIDLNDLKKAYGSTYGLPAWNSNCDVNGDNKVDVLDLFLQSKNYGKTDI